MTWLNDWIVEHVPSYKYALKQADPRTKNWFLLWCDPFPAVSLTIMYLLIVFFGSNYMRHREAIHVPTIILFIYNMGLVVLSAYMVEEILVGVYKSNYNLICEKYVVSYNENQMKISRALWFYYFSKCIEFFDTIFMILRKRFTQVTFLHVFHHSTMFMIWWIVMTWIPSGQTWFGAVFNSLVHVFMYSYYGLSLIPSLRDKLWWKKYITIFQLIQFIVVFSHTLGGLLNGCDFPLWGQFLLGGYMVIMLILFLNFYIHEYITRSNEKKRCKQKSNILKQNGIHVIKKSK